MQPARNRPLLSLVLPVFNEEESVPHLLEALRQIDEQLESIDLEVIFVDDHSTDRSPELLREICRQEPAMRYFRLARNSGSHVAILAGLAQARGSCAVFLAADLQDPPRLLPELLAKWREGHRIVWAVRERRESIPLVDRSTSALFYWLMNRFSDVTLPPQGSDFALLDRAAIDALLASRVSNPSLVGEIARLGFSTAEIPYTKEARRYGRSKWSLRMKLRAAVDAMVSFSHVPMRLMIYTGAVVSLLAFLYIALIIFLRLAVDRAIEGWASTMVVLLGLGGLQMVMLGVLGEYLWRNLEESRKRPLYLIEESLDAEPEPAEGTGD